MISYRGKYDYSVAVLVEGTLVTIKQMDGAHKWTKEIKRNKEQINHPKRNKILHKRGQRNKKQRNLNIEEHYGTRVGKYLLPSSVIHQFWLIPVSFNLHNSISDSTFQHCLPLRFFVLGGSEGGGEAALTRAFFEKCQYILVLAGCAVTVPTIMMAVH